MKLRCPCCHASNSLEAFTADEAGRELLVLLAGTGPLFKPLVAYLGLFRPASRDLSHSRALKLAKEVVNIGADPRALAHALTETVEAIRAKRDSGQVKPLTNHNYLKRVLETVAALPPTDFKSEISDPQSRPQGASGKRRQALDALAAWGDQSTLHNAIATGLAGLVAIGRPGTPAADMIAMNADMWLHLLKKRGLVATEDDCKRVIAAFSGLVQQPFKEWPEPAVLVAYLPRRKHQDSLPEPPPTPVQRAAAAAAARKAMEGLI
jgi:hypothetical protein